MLYLPAKQVVAHVNSEVARKVSLKINIIILIKVNINLFIIY